MRVQISEDPDLELDQLELLGVEIGKQGKESVVRLKSPDGKDDARKWKKAIAKMLQTDEPSLTDFIQSPHEAGGVADEEKGGSMKSTTENPLVSQVSPRMKCPSAMMYNASFLETSR